MFTEAGFQGFQFSLIRGTDAQFEYARPRGRDTAEAAGREKGEQQEPSVM
jgi:hypothetical protein